MIKFINILSNVISEAKRYQLSPEDYTKLLELTDRLWASRSKDLPRKTEVDQIEVKTADGSDAKIRVFLNPRYKNYGEMDIKPRTSVNPQKFVMQLNPKNYGSKKNLFNTLFHEIMHATDPNFTTKYNEKYWADYDPTVDEKYWGHPVEFRAVTNEVLQSLVNEFKRRNDKVRNTDNKKYLLKSLDNIINYFAKNEPLSKLSLNILERLSDEGLNDNKYAKLLADIPTDFPNTAELMPKNEPYYLKYINTIKKFNPDMWPRFLTMLYKTSDEIKDILNEKKV
jgi:hypothetical protein